MAASESNRVGKIIEVLFSFSKELLISHLNKDDIKNKAIQKFLATTSKTKKKEKGKILVLL